MHHTNGPDVKCVVDSCEYWENGNHCTASAIEVQPPHASGTEETDCATFKPKPGYETQMSGAEALKGVSGNSSDLNATMGTVDPTQLR